MNTAARVLALLMFAVAVPAPAQHQTSTFSPVQVGSDLPYGVDLRKVTLGSAALPSLHSYAAAEYDGKWVLLSGRTNGLHGFSQMAAQNFPTADRNFDVWVIDPVAGESWSRSLHPDDQQNSGLTATQAISIGTTNNQFVQLGDRLYLTGGYTFGDGQNGTASTLTALDLPGLVGWVQGGQGTAADHIRQASDPLFQVTGGAMYEMNDKIHLVFGQNFFGGYQPGRNGDYTEQVRSFEIVDDGVNLSFANATSTTPNPDFHRRDLNVYPVLKPDGAGGIEEGLTALSGVFTAANGVWTVPVEIDALGQPSMANPNAEGVFQQAMNQYHSAKLGMYSGDTGEMHELLFGGITVNQYDYDNEDFVRDDGAPNTSQITSVVVDENGDYSQHLLGAFPYLDDGAGSYWRLGANAEFMVAPGVPRFDNGVIDFDALPAGDNVVGYIFGGLAANADHVRNNPSAISVASDMLFEVTIRVAPRAVPEPSSLAGVLLGSALAWGGWRRIRR
ncbi:hypothetical protein Pla123a_34080 [Posidoniimonas polymericola]|uniref:PEP-CTERM protein-sorting domain-containing protein n=1 Tax=Posidoniimonas polymericola TaxID=2528002 RepID=A0A5C5YI85_9BACT|nr:PEP-CTERM sorting domain-containing protein [Posidoniimonas polymericola]TWT74584.1 hypothetical protein Pla123a_34080 [Posidoniimonas polymericola]